MVNILFNHDHPILWQRDILHLAARDDMASVAKTADWVKAERRKVNVVLLALPLVCLLVAIFPRNERRLFTFDGERGTSATTPHSPALIRLRAGIFRQPGFPQGRQFTSPAGAAGIQRQPVLELSSEWILFDDSWRRGLGGEPLQFSSGGQLPSSPT